MVKKQINKRRVFIVIIGIITVFTVYLVVRGDKPLSTQTNENVTPSPVETIKAEFSCTDGKSISAEFINGEERSVDLTLSDGRKIILNSAVSADGARYANKDENIVFWNVGNTATFEENGVITFDNCTDES